MSEALKPCPYCGGPSETYESSSWGWYPQCMGENCEIDPISEEAFSTEAEAITAWNTRPGEQAACEAGRAAGRAEERARIVAALREEVARLRTLADVHYIGGDHKEFGSLSKTSNTLHVWANKIADAREEKG